MVTIIRNDHVNAESVIAPSLNLRAVSANPYETSVDDAITLQQLADDIVSSALFLGVDSDSLQGILEAVNAVISVRKHDYEEKIGLISSGAILANNTADNMI